MKILFGSFGLIALDLIFFMWKGIYRSPMQAASYNYRLEIIQSCIEYELGNILSSLFLKETFISFDIHGSNINMFRCINYNLFKNRIKNMHHFHRSLIIVYIFSDTFD